MTTSGWAFCLHQILENLYHMKDHSTVIDPMLGACIYAFVNGKRRVCCGGRNSIVKEQDQRFLWWAPFPDAERRSRTCLSWSLFPNVSVSAIQTKSQSWNWVSSVFKYLHFRGSRMLKYVDAWSKCRLREQQRMNTISNNVFLCKMRILYTRTWVV